LFNGPVGVSGPTGAQLTSFNSVGAMVSNGLHATTPQFLLDGYDVTLSGLSIFLGPGTYTLGLTSDGTNGFLASIGSGPGSGQTIGTGMYQGGLGANVIHVGAHMAFTVIGVVPEPSAGVLLLLPCAVQGVRMLRKRKH